MEFTFTDTRIEFARGCLDELAQHRQKTWWSLENGGQLFARIDGGKITVERTTVTKGLSRRTRFGFLPDRATEQADIDAMFAAGLHYLGDWHTHPEPTPQPSATDKEKLTDIFRRSTHRLQFMLLVIVGQAAFPRGLYVAAINADAVFPLAAIVPPA